MLRMMRAPGIAAAFILMLLLTAIQFTDEVGWSLGDFVFAGILLFGTGLAYELVAKKMGSVTYRAAVGVALAAALLLVWVNGAVGIIGSEDNPANLMYVGVLAVGVIGVIIARFQPEGMARALFGTALAQALVAVIALIAMETDPSFWGEATGMQDLSPVFQLLGVNGMFIALFLGSAWLFRSAARGRGIPLVQGRRVDQSAGR